MPESGVDYTLIVEIWKGFDEGERDVHFHLGTHSRYRSMEYVLDLTAYLSSGWVVSEEPRFYLHPQDHPHGDMCSRREARDAIAPHASANTGVYRWKLSDVSVGIVDIVWDVALAAHRFKEPVHGIDNPSR